MNKTESKPSFCLYVSKTGSLATSLNAHSVTVGMD